MCAYRAALSMDTSVSGQPLAPEARQRAHDRLQFLVKKAGLADTWTRIERKSAEVTPALIEQQLRANRMGDAVRTYKKSQEFSSKTKPRFHVEVGRVFKEFPNLKDMAIEAFNVAMACEGGSAAACHEMGDIKYEARMYDEATEWYTRALALEPAHGLSLSGIANCEKDKGNLEAAVKTYSKAVAAAPADPTFVFNLAQVRAREGCANNCEALAVLCHESLYHAPYCRFHTCWPQ